MAKATAIYTGTSSRGVPEDYARREDGVWFCRHRAFNGYGVGWTKWRRTRESLDAFIVNDGAQMDYGFTPLRRGEPKGLRLPNPAA